MTQLGMSFIRAELGSSIKRLHHTAIVVSDMEDAIERWRALSGAEVETRELVRDQLVEIAMLQVDGSCLELIRPTDPETGVGRFLARRGESLHHIAFEVQEIGDVLRRLADAGYELIDSEPRSGAGGLIAFVHPRSTGGVLVELIQP